MKSVIALAFAAVLLSSCASSQKLSGGKTFAG